MAIDASERQNRFLRKPGMKSAKSLPAKSFVAGIWWLGCHGWSAVAGTRPENIEAFKINNFPSVFRAYAASVKFHLDVDGADCKNTFRAAQENASQRWGARMQTPDSLNFWEGPSLASVMMPPVHASRITNGQLESHMRSCKKYWKRDSKQTHIENQSLLLHEETG